MAVNLYLLLFVLKACVHHNARLQNIACIVLKACVLGRTAREVITARPETHAFKTLLRVTAQDKQAGKIFCSCWLVKLEAVNKEFCSKFVSSGSSSYSVIEPKSVISSSLQSKRGMSHLDECSILTSKTQSKRHKR